MAVYVAILCLAISVCHVMNKAGMCGRSVDYIMSQPFFSLFISKERTDDVTP